jgi:DNA-binding MarR family transcriptional regulator
MFRPNFKLIKSFRMGMTYATRQMKDINISSGLVFFIVELSQVEWLNLSDLSSAVGVDNAYATRAVQKLCTLGYVNKIHDEKDKRAYRISLTDSGKQIAERVNDTLREWVSIITIGVDKEEILTVNRVFDQFYENSIKALNRRNP